MEIDQLIEFVKEADKLKNVNRKSFTYHDTRYENSGEHSWHLALAALVFAGESNQEVDVLKCIKMAVIHDLVEIDAGDQLVYAEDEGKFERELLAAKKIFALLPEALGEELLSLWIEFEKKESAESQFVGALDRFLPLFSNVLNKGHTWKENGISAEQVYKLNEPAISSGSRTLWQKTDRYLKESIEKGHLR